MPAKVETVTIPRAMYDEMEERGIELTAIKTVLVDSARILEPYVITAVITSPPTGSAAKGVLEAVRHLAAVAHKFAMPKASIHPQ